jgi:hypothetical protein
MTRCSSTLLTILSGIKGLPPLGQFRGPANVERPRGQTRRLDSERRDCTVDFDEQTDVRPRGIAFLTMRDSPSIVPEIASDEALAAAVATIQQFADAKREGDREALEDAAQRFERVPGLRETVHEVANGKTYAEVQGGRWGKRSREKRQRNEKIAREYQKRELAYELRNVPISFTDLAIQIGRLPEFNLKKNASIDAIKRGLAIINRHRVTSI